jgi:hypothetical protein
MEYLWIRKKQSTLPNEINGIGHLCEILLQVGKTAKEIKQQSAHSQDQTSKTDHIS